MTPQEKAKFWVISIVVIPLAYIYVGLEQIYYFF